MGGVAMIRLWIIMWHLPIIVDPTLEYKNGAPLSDASVYPIISIAMRAVF
jgi:hypothetical protein